MIVPGVLFGYVLYRVIRLWQARRNGEKIKVSAILNVVCDFCLGMYVLFLNLSSDGMLKADFSYIPLTLFIVGTIIEEIVKKRFEK